MTDKRQSDALHLADIADDGAWTFVIGVRKEIATELRRQHIELEALRTGYAAARLEIASLQAQLEALASQPQPVAELVTTAHGFETTLSVLPGHFDLLYGTHLLYAALPRAADTQQTPTSVLHLVHGAFAEIAMAFPKAFALHKVGIADTAVREALAAPAGAGMGHTDGGRNMFYEGRFDGESKREQQARLRWADDMRAAFERHTGNGWFDKDWRTETGLWSSAWHACLAAQPTTTEQAAPTCKDSTPELHIGDSTFESWYSTYSPAHKSDKQRARDAYAAGMGDPLVTAALAAVAGPSEAVAYLDVGAGGYLDLGTGLTDEALSRLPKGRHALVIAGTYGIDGYIAAPTTQPAPQQEAQERVYLVATGETLNGRELYERHEKYVPLADCETLYTAPQPSPAAKGDALESEYQRGYRQGYEQRDAEVRGALV